MKSTLTALAVVMVDLAGCATTREWSATGGSRSDGVVTLSYQYDLFFERPQVSEQQGFELAKSRCAAWGYAGAEAFDVQTQRKVCDASMLSTCSWLVTRKYQCTGTLEKQ